MDNLATQQETGELTPVWKALLSPSSSPLVGQPAIPKLTRMSTLYREFPHKIRLISFDPSKSEPVDPPEWML